MFEKEAEEYAKKRAKELWINECNLAYATMERAFQKGAEFAYNKANKELQKAKQIIQELLELNYSEFTKTNAVFLHADKFLKESE